MKKQRGTTLVELMLTLSLMGIIAVSSVAVRNSQMDVDIAKALGLKLLEYNTAVQSYISTNPDIDAPVTKTGTAWLKDASCAGGTSSHPYLPCEFPDFMLHNESNFGHVRLTTTLTKGGVAGENYINADTKTTPIYQNHVQRSDLAGVAAIIAASGRSAADSPALMGTNASYGSHPLSAVVTMNATNNPAGDSWLRTDGANTMKANLVFDAALAVSQRAINNVSNIQSHESEKLSIASESGESEHLIEADRVASQSGSSSFDITPTSAKTAVGSASFEVRSGQISTQSGSSLSEVNPSSIVSKSGSVSSREILSDKVVAKVGSTSVEVDSEKVSTKGSHQFTGAVAIGQDSDVDFGILWEDPESVYATVRAAIEGDVKLNNGTLYLSDHIMTNGRIHTDGDIHVDHFMSDEKHPSEGTSDSIWVVTPGGLSIINHLNVTGSLTLNQNLTSGNDCHDSWGMMGSETDGTLMTCWAGNWRRVSVFTEDE